MARYYLTGRANFNLAEIYEYSINTWGWEVAERYMISLYGAIERTATHPDLGVSLQGRTYPYLAIPAARHLVLYEKTRHGIVIVAVPHARRDIEGLLRRLSPQIALEVLELRRRLGEEPD